MLREILRCMQYDLIVLKPKLNQMYFCVDSKKLWKDNGTTKEHRQLFNAIILNTENERINIRPVVGNFYYIIETNTLWLFDNRWILKIGNEANYNAYSTDKQILTPVINPDETITSSLSGDKIIDNNGLLSNGSVCIRDNVRIIRGIAEIDSVYQQLNIKSYLDNGIVLIPNAHLPFQDPYTSFGALQLYVNRDENSNGSLTYDGKANYYGEWNNYGEMYIVKTYNDEIISPTYYPETTKEIIKYYIKCIKLDEENKRIITYIVIRPIGEEEGLIQILSIYEEFIDSIIINDVGDLIFTNFDNLIDNTIIACNKNVENENECIYTLDQYGVTIKLKIQDNEIIAEIPEIWIDDNNYEIEIKKWVKCVIMTEEDVLKINNRLKVIEEKLEL